MNRRYLITGCSGGGKSTLIERLAQRGQRVIREPGLRVIHGAGPKPWEDRLGFFAAAHRVSLDDLANTADAKEPIFFDRGLFDALSGMASRRKVPISRLIQAEFHYAAPVFYVPPWPDIYEQTDDRPHGFEVALDEAKRLRRDLALLGIEVIELPRISVDRRAEIVLEAVA
ncbi:MAG: AAA family ATPase [Pseudomonadota bacterium]